MAANGIPDELFISIFKNTVDGIKGLSTRVREATYNEADVRLLSISEVSSEVLYMRLT
jgi:hypothetical protein